MKMVVCSVFDRAAQAFGRPIFVATRGVALRSFGDEVTRSSQDNPMYSHPSDYELFQLGFWDDSNGEFTSDQQLISRAEDLVVRDQG